MPVHPIPGASSIARTTWLVLALFASAAQAQMVGARVVAVDINHPRIGGLLGAALAAEAPLGDGRWVLTFGLERTTDGSDDIGIACGSLSPPGTCPSEPVRNHASASTVSMGVGGVVVDRRAWAVRLFVDAGISRVTTETRGRTTGNTLSAAKTMFRGGAGAETSWRPWHRTPVALDAGVSLGFQTPFDSEVLVDAFTPLDRSSRVVRLWLGASWRPRPRHSQSGG
jgi:hypothetical protein